jgi:hypothetical protein
MKAVKQFFVIFAMWLLRAVAFDFDVEDEYMRQWMAAKTSGSSLLKEKSFIDDSRILLVIPGVGFQEERTRIIFNNLKILQLSQGSQFSCLLFAYHIPPPYMRKEVELYCDIQLYMYVNFAHYLKAVVPSLVATSGYTHVMILLDDIQLPYTFRLSDMMSIMTRNNLSVISPTIIGATYPATTCTFCKPRLRTEKGKTSKLSDMRVGHKVEVIEIFATLFTLSAWRCWWDLLQPRLNSIGWAYDKHMYRYCKQRDSEFSMGMVTSIMAVHGTGRLSYTHSTGARPADPYAEVKRWLNVTKYESLVGDENFIGDFLI